MDVFRKVLDIAEYPVKNLEALGVGGDAGFCGAPEFVSKNCTDVCVIVFGVFLPVAGFYESKIFSGVFAFCDSKSEMVTGLGVLDGEKGVACF